MRGSSRKRKFGLSPIVNRLKRGTQPPRPEYQARGCKELLVNLIVRWEFVIR